MAETEATVIPQLRQVFRLTMAQLNALAGLRDGALGFATDNTNLYRQNGDGAANWEMIAQNAAPLIAAHAALATVHQDAPVIAAALIATHAGLPTVHQDAAALIATHAALATIHQDASALAAALIATHAGLPTVHQDAAALAAALIATHAGLPTVHQDAPGLIATHAAIAGVHHAAFSGANGNYAGNSSANRAVPHGLGVVPKAIFIVDPGFNFLFRILVGTANIFFIASTIGKYSVTALNSTNFYVGNAGSYSNSANDSGKTYYWVAIG